MQKYEFPKTLTPANFQKLSQCWKLSSYGKSKDTVQKIVRNFFNEQRVQEYFRSANDGGHTTIENYEISNEINSIFEEVQRWGGKTGMRKRNDWQPASKLPYLRYMINALNCKSLSEIPNIAYNLSLDIKGLGLSFATKHLKFATDLAVVFDSRIVSATGLKNSKDGYATFLLACQSKSVELSDKGFKLSIQEVEEAFFQSTYSSQ